MHKKPIYSFENKDKKGVGAVPLMSIIHIENSSNLPELDGNNEPRLVIMINKNNMPNDTVKEFITDTSNWIWLWNGHLFHKFENYVLKAGDTMTGNLKMTGGASLDIQGSGIVSTTSGSISTVSGDVTSGGSMRVNKYFELLY